MHLDSFHSKSPRCKTLQTAVRNRNLGQPSHFPTVHVGTSIYECVCVRARVCVCVCVCVSTDSSRNCIIHPTQLTHVSTLRISFLYYSPLLWCLLLLLLSSALLCRYNMLFLRAWRFCLLDFFCLLPHCLQNALKLCFACMNIYCGVLITGQETEPECFVDPCHMTRERESGRKRERERERRRDKDALTNLKEQLSSYPEVR